MWPINVFLKNRKPLLNLYAQKTCFKRLPKDCMPRNGLAFSAPNRLIVRARIIRQRLTSYPPVYTNHLAAFSDPSHLSTELSFLSFSLYFSSVFSPTLSLSISRFSLSPIFLSLFNFTIRAFPALDPQSHTAFFFGFLIFIFQLLSSFTLSAILLVLTILLNEAIWRRDSSSADARTF